MARMLIHRSLARIGTVIEAVLTLLVLPRAGPSQEFLSLESKAPGSESLDALNEFGAAEEKYESEREKKCAGQLLLCRQ